MSRKLLPFPPTNVLLVRLTARGDVVFSSPVVRAFRRTYPDARITWLVEAHTKDLIEHHPELDEIMVLPRSRWQNLLKRGRWWSLFGEVGGFISQLRERRFDLAVDMQGLLRSGVVTFLSGAPLRVGLRPQEGNHLFMTQVLDRNRDQGDRTRISSEYLYLAQELGLETGDFRMEVHLSPNDREVARDRLFHGGVEERYAVAIPFTTRPQKHWFEERWGELLDRLQHEMDLPSVILGGPGDQEALDRIRKSTQSPPVSLVGQTSLTQAAAVVEGASLVLGVDTGLTHMGTAFRRPTVALFGSTIPYTRTPGAPTRVLVHRLDCSPCRTNPTCDGEFTCMRLISVDEVLSAARKVLVEGSG